MRRFFPILGFFFLTLGLYAAETTYVQVRETQIRETPSFVGRILATVPYGQALRVEKKTGAWNQVAPAAGRPGGWVHSSALTAKKLALSAGSSSAGGASSQEVALAGKGFNAQVEAQYREDNQDLDYASIDRMEALHFSPQELARFMTQAGLVPAGGEK